MAENINANEMVPEFILGDSLVNAVTEGRELSGESKVYTLEHKRNGTYVYGLNAGSYVKDSIMLSLNGKEVKRDVWNKENLEKYKALNKTLRLWFRVICISLALITIALVLYLELR